MIVYGGVSPALALIWRYQARQPGGDPPIIAPIPGWMRLLLTTQAAVMLLGAGLYGWLAARRAK